jgi:hypothetical protein
MPKFIVTVQRTITTEIVVENVASARAARQFIEDYGPDLAATDMASQDIGTSAKIKSVRPGQ